MEDEKEQNDKKLTQPEEANAKTSPVNESILVLVNEMIEGMSDPTSTEEFVTVVMNFRDSSAQDDYHTAQVIVSLVLTHIKESKSPLELYDVLSMGIFMTKDQVCVS